jgi:phenylpropionate dioxygenase-like ring-hydroxylating dioxygenase large terminal subunit
VKRFEIHPEVERAHTLDADFYRDPAVFDQVRERIYTRHWLWLGDLDDLRAPGTVSPRTLMPGLLDEPLLLARDAAGQLRALSNVCTHRANLLVHEPGRASQIRCGYHGRRFDLAGRMLAMPGFKGACDFPAAGDHLPQVPLGDWHGHAFVALAPTTPLAELLDPIEQRLPGLELASLRADPARARDFEFDAHWALYVENYLEGLHIPFLHPGLSATLDLAGYRYELGAHGNLQIAAARAGQAAFEPPPGSPEHGQRIAAYYWWLFPNLMLNFYPWGLSLNLVLPLTPTRTRVLFRAYVADPGLLGRGAGGALDPVELEDEAVVQAVQRGIRSRLYRRGRYSPTHERGVHQFHRLLAAQLA